MTANFQLSATNHLLGELDILVETSRHNMKYVEAAGGYDSERIVKDTKAKAAMADCVRTAIELCDLAEKLFTILKCVHIDAAIRALRHWATSPEEWSELNTRSRALRNAIQYELREYLYYQYPKDKGAKLRAWKTDWDKTVTAFPNVQREIFDATDCYALGHDTAAVFHSMRVAEHGLRALAREREIKLAKDKPIEWATWQEIIRSLDEEIKMIGAKKAGGAKDAALAFYSGARADLNGFKDEYRNSVMHVRAHYDDLQALRALTKVREFMERISEKINHTHRPIDWGDL